ncbi:hypothetical protein, partial [Solicola sp. PLA-1-18]|uniref:hypothetical protein n=1 Tax=Solicola sp. PLA-1-18 TaxID=3380532 RepID=UPI003B798BB4
GMSIERWRHGLDRRLDDSRVFVPVVVVSLAALVWSGVTQHRPTMAVLVVLNVLLWRSFQRTDTAFDAQQQDRVARIRARDDARRAAAAEFRRRRASDPPHPTN